MSLGVWIVLIWLGINIAAPFLVLLIVRAAEWRPLPSPPPETKR